MHKVALRLMVVGSLLSVGAQAGVIGLSSTPPTENVAVDNLVPLHDFLTIETEWTSASAIQKAGQTFQVGSAFTLDSIVLKMGTAFGSSDFSSGTHGLQLAILQNTGSGSDANKGDFTVSLESYDVSGLTFSDLVYVSFDLATNIPILADTVYQWEVWWTAADAQNNLVLYSSDDFENSDPSGIGLWTDDLSTTFPLGDSFTDAVFDIDYALIAAIPEPSALVMAGLLTLLAAHGLRRRG